MGRVQVRDEEGSGSGWVGGFRVEMRRVQLLRISRVKVRNMRKVKVRNDFFFESNGFFTILVECCIFLNLYGRHVLRFKSFLTSIFL